MTFCRLLFIAFYYFATHDLFMKYLICLCLSVFVLTSCSSEKCEPYRSIVKLGSKKIAEIGECNQEKIENILNKAIVKVGLCSEQSLADSQLKSKSTSAIICLAVPTAVQYLEEKGLEYLECKKSLNLDEIVSKALGC